MIGLSSLYILVGIFFALVALSNLRLPLAPQRLKNALFWGINAIIMLAGTQLPPFMVGCLVIVSVICVSLGKGKPARHKSPQPSAPHQSVADPLHARGQRFGLWLLMPALLVPGLTLAGNFLLPLVQVSGQPLVTPSQATLVSLVLAILVALVVALVMLRAAPLVAITEGGRLLEAIGWASVLPQMLAVLGGIFAAAGVGGIIAHLVTETIPMTNSVIVVTTYCLGMALFTVIMGNAFAAFPVMTVGIGLPFIVHGLHGNPAIMSALGMLCGFCGTLMTPMAANFNLVPVALLELPRPTSVIRAQLPAALILLLCNILLMNLLVFRF